MKTLYIECKMGAAGDMLTGALLELLPEEERKTAVATLENLGIDGVKFSTEKILKCGIQGTCVHVTVNGEEEGDHHHDHHHHDHDHHHEGHEHHHHHETFDHSHEHHHDEHEHHHHDDHDTHGHEVQEHHHHHGPHAHHKLSDISNTIASLRVSDKVKRDAVAVYNLIAQAESHAHGVEVDQIHFHEVGNKDAIMDVTAVCYLMDLMGAEKIIASQINVGSGTVHCAHGIMPVPAPATEFILRGIPYYQGEIKSELCTPTGAALLKYFAEDFCSQPPMKIQGVGIGCGKKDFEQANCVRIFLGETCDKNLKDHILQLEANVDDMTAEEIGFALDRLFEAGALEAFTSPVYMKKNRPGTMITVICAEEKKDGILETFFRHTTTIGIREKKCSRYVLKRELTEVETPMGTVHKKISEGYGSRIAKIEYDDLAKIAMEKNMSLREVRRIIEKSNQDQADDRNRK